jgi:hypothetical protein
MLSMGFGLEFSSGAISNIPANTYKWNVNKQLTHTTPITLVSGSKTITFTWTSPATGNANVVLDISGNAVNNSANVNGDEWSTTQLTSTAIYVNPIVTATLGTIPCNGGVANVTAVGNFGTPPYQYKLNSGTFQSSALYAAQSAGIYTITLMDATSNTVATTVTLTQPNVLKDTLINTYHSACYGGFGGAAQQISGGTPGYTYLWAPSGSTGQATGGVIPNTVFTATVTDSRGCTASTTISVTQPAQFFITTSSTNIACNGGANGIMSVAATGGFNSFTYSWNTVPIQTTATANNVPPGTYTITVKDNIICPKTATVTITQPTAMTATGSNVTLTCYGQTNGSACITAGGGVSPYSYNWAPSIGTASCLPGQGAGIYTCTVTDANLCTKTKTITITQSAYQITPSITSSTNLTCFGSTNGGALAAAYGGTGSLTYNWMPGSINTLAINNIVAGTYTFTAKDANNCTKTATVTITSPTAINPNETIVHPTCFGLVNGNINLNVNGGTSGYTYLWAPGSGTASSMSSLSIGSYSCTITDANNCSTSTQITITQPTILTTILTANSVSCKNGNDGLITNNANGGTAPYIYNWQPITSTNPNLNGISAGNYTCTITDAHNCSTSSIVTLVNSSDTANATFNITNNTLTAIQPSSIYQWYKCKPTFTLIPGATNLNFTINSGSDYALVITSGSCKDTSECITVNPLGLVANKSNSIKIELVSLNTFMVKNLTNSTINYSIINMNGQVIIKDKINLGENIINLNNQVAGIYFIKVDNSSFKIMVE